MAKSNCRGDDRSYFQVNALWCSIGIITVTVILLSMCTFMFVEYFDRSNEEAIERYADVVTTYFKTLDDKLTEFPASMAVGGTSAESASGTGVCPDSVMRFEKAVKAHIAYIELQQERMVNDIRQETSSNLDKLNCWYAFWVAILTLLCGIVPILTQYKIYHDSKSRMDAVYREIEETQFRIEKELSSSSLQMMVSSIREDTNNRLFSDSNMRSRLITHLLGETRNIINEMRHAMAYGQNGFVSEADRPCYIAMLVQVFDLLDYISLAYSGQRFRMVNNMREDVRAQLSVMLNSPYGQNHQCDNSESAMYKIAEGLNRLISLIDQDNQDAAS